MVVLVATVVLVHLGSMYFYAESAFDSANRAHSRQISERIAEATSKVSSNGTESRDAIAHKLSSASLMLHWSEFPLVDDGRLQDSNLFTLRAQLAEIISSIEVRDIRLEYRDRLPPSRAHAILGTVRLVDGSFLNFNVPLMAGTDPAFHGALLSTSIMAVGVAIIALLLMRTLISPLHGLAKAADAIGRGPNIKVDEGGPDEVRVLAEAFNAMQSRISSLIADRIQALAAVSHDLRTPITRLRLRAAFLDVNGQKAVDADLDEMEAMIDETLAYLRGDIETESPTVVDLAALLSTLVDAATDRGLSASFSGPRHAFLLAHSISLKRAFANIIDNALTYGESARVCLSKVDAATQITVDDDGPGIPEGELQGVFEPFRRLEKSRSSQTGGVGLGLTIARQAILREGGTIRLLNRPTGGLRTEIVIPSAFADLGAPNGSAQSSSDIPSSSDRRP